MTALALFATTPRGMEALLAAELREFGARNVSQGSAGVSFSAPLEVAYRSCLWSRIANRILLSLGEFSVANEAALYAVIHAIDWSQHISATSTLAVNVHSEKSKVSHTRFAAQRIKDAIVDQFRASEGVRPSVDRDQPDLRINGYLHRNRLRLSLDLSGGSLHRRGYRQRDSGAPLKENLAAALLAMADWPAMAKRGMALLDPMCGSGTLLIEGAMMAADIAPGLSRQHYGFSGWKQHDAGCWEQLLEEAQARRVKGLLALPPIAGSDVDTRALQCARDNVAAADLLEHISLVERNIDALQSADIQTGGLLITNPPYGQRMEADGQIAKLYSSIGKTLRKIAQGEIAQGKISQGKAAIFTGNPTLAHRFRVAATDTVSLRNGDLDCKLLIYTFDKKDQTSRTKINSDAPASVPTNEPTSVQEEPQGAEMFANRLRKNLKSLRGWAKSANVQCYRLYDADLPDYAVAIDYFPGIDKIDRVHVQEYAPPKTIDAARAAQRLAQVVAAVPDVLTCDPRQVYLKVRSRQRGDEQYKKLARREEFHAVSEANAKLLINLADYQDCGLFLDHRKVRQKVYTLAKGKRVLNLFAYTGAASVQAALGGADAVTTIDMSATYLEWARKNFALNQLESENYAFIRADCLEWLGQKPSGSVFDVILLDPPTFSNSKKMADTWDVQRDHNRIIGQTMKRLAPAGILLFSTNRQGFKLDKAVEKAFLCREISKQTVPRDFSRNARIHRCWEITHRC